MFRWRVDLGILSTSIIKPYAPLETIPNVSRCIPLAGMKDSGQFLPSDVFGNQETSLHDIVQYNIKNV